MRIKLESLCTTNTKCLGIAPCYVKDVQRKIDLYILYESLVLA